MARPAFDADALITMFEQATAEGSAKLRKAVADATLQALQGRELTLKNIRGVLGTVTQAASAGLANNPAAVDADKLLDQAVAGMDDAVLKAVDAHRVALQQLAAQGADLRDKQLKKALADLDRFEDMIIDTLEKAASSAGEPLAAAWAPVLGKLQAGGTASGAQAASVVEQLKSQAKQVQEAVRGSRDAGLRAAQALAEGYTAMVSGVLIGMSDAMRPPAAKSAPRKAAK